ncbi:ribokinase [Enhydrobacter aerosaccus]|uniref:Ribokinase n=1 Tax=Enhydrobacter aerosaccus TaxID=225324 RepID=A0A1T4L5F9_9HYPH|nr:ribokinase [Enhydrobacter aerosaccus]SJZ49878.1 ribokinase [Enhydrobacter aerosaccus]
MSRVIVCGSLNMDVVVQSARRPAAGETLLGAEVAFLPGGKGLNQAVASARLGAPTSLIGAVGDDSFGKALRSFLADNNVDTLGLGVVAGQASGLALIQVAEGDNAITVASGANHHFSAAMVHATPQRDEVWMAQFETPLAATDATMRQARQAQARTVLNLAPFLAPPPELLQSIDIAVLNEIELSQAVGVALDSASAESAVIEACQMLRAQGPRAVVATLGPRGVVVVTSDGAVQIPGYRVPVVDTTGAGDCFVGALAARLADGATPFEAARYGNAAAACSVQRLGAAPSMPTAEEVAARLASA